MANNQFASIFNWKRDHFGKITTLIWIDFAIVSLEGQKTSLEKISLNFQKVNTCFTKLVMVKQVLTFRKKTSYSNIIKVNKMPIFRAKLEYLVFFIVLHPSQQLWSRRDS